MAVVPPTPETSASLFVWALVLLAGLSTVLTVLVLRRRRHVLLNLTFALLTLVLLGAGAVFATLPPSVASAAQPWPRRCPYDRLVWSDMGPALDGPWLPCRREARLELALMMLGHTVITVGAGVAGVRLTSGPPDGTDRPFRNELAAAPVTDSVGSR